MLGQVPEDALGCNARTEDNFAVSGEEVKLSKPSWGPARAEMGVMGGAGLRSAKQTTAGGIGEEDKSSDDDENYDVGEGRGRGAGLGMRGRSRGQGSSTVRQGG